MIKRMDYYCIHHSREPSQRMLKNRRCIEKKCRHLIILKSRKDKKEEEKRMFKTISKQPRKVKVKKDNLKNSIKFLKTYFRVGSDIDSAIENLNYCSFGYDEDTEKMSILFTKYKTADSVAVGKYNNEKAKVQYPVHLVNYLMGLSVDLTNIDKCIEIGTSIFKVNDGDILVVFPLWLLNQES